MAFLRLRASDPVEPVYRELQGIFEQVFGRRIPRITAATTAKDIARWDSLTHLNLIIAIEEHFRTRFAAAEIRAFRTVGDVAALLLERASSKVAT